MPYYKDTDIVRYSDKGAEHISDIVVEEYPLTLFLEGREFVTLLCSPEDFGYLVTGFLLSEGFIKTNEDIDSMRIDKDKGIAEIELKGGSILAEKLYGTRTITSGCGRGPVFYNVKDSIDTQGLDKDGLKIGYQTIAKLMKEFDGRAIVFKKTGGVHSCALGTGEGIEIYHEDIGRHNAMDKVLGHAVQKNLNFGECIALTSGRISSEMLIKAAKRGIPVIASRSAPTVLAVELANRLNITLAGFVRGRRFNVYSGFNRIK
jgi:FdhD protein